MMARRARAYPQVTPTAADLLDGAILTVPPTLTAADALRLARRRGVDVLSAAERAFVLREDLARAESLGVGELPVRRLSRPLPVLGAGTGEIAVRRALAAGAPAVVVMDGRRPAGVVRRAPPPVAISMRARLARVLDTGSLELLATTGRLAAAVGATAYAVGGLVRDAWLGRRPGPGDLDVVVEGDALAVARAVADAEGGTLVEHARFLTASVTLSDGRRLDLVTARSERYEGGGALPRVLPAAIAQDLRRRDFTVNAMAVELGSDTFGLLDPLGGAVDVARRTLRVLHPLSFVEDPTRIFRAARYAARLGFALDAWSARGRALALELAPYAGLSPARIVAELEHILADAEPGRALATLARAGAFRVVDPRHRSGRTLAQRLAGVPATLAWAQARGLAVRGVELVATALAAGQPAEVAAAVLRRLGLAGAPLERVQAALDGAGELASRLEAVHRPSDADRLARATSPTALAWLHLAGDANTRIRLGRRLPTRAGRPELGGDAVIALGVPRGPAVARVLGALRAARLDGEIRDRQGEIDYVKTWLQHKEG
jgi:tRNA nucleotidyltransferase (CCA-adding enzyme)